jgi:hypothetical protein
MRDASLSASAVIALGATKDTPIAGADTYEFGTIASLFRNTSHQTGAGQPSLLAVFMNTADMVATDTFSGQVYECATVGGTYTLCATTGLSALGAKAGSRVTCQIPSKHLKFLKFYATGQSSGTLTTKDIWAWFEPGANQ